MIARHTIAGDGSPSHRKPGVSTMSLRTLRILGGLVLVVLIVSGIVMPASAQNMQSLVDRIDRLERDIQTLNIQIARGASVAMTTNAGESAGKTQSTGQGISPSGVAHLNVRITSLENDLRTVTGNVEKMGFQITQLKNRVEKLVSDVDYRLSELERRTAIVQGRRNNLAANQASQSNQGGESSGLVAQDDSAVPQSVTPEMPSEDGILGTITADQLKNIGTAADTTGQTAGTASGQGADSTESAQTKTTTASVGQSVDETAIAGNDQAATETPQDAYAKAFALLRQAKYDEAATALQAFVDKYGDSDLASNARYWLGETYYVRSEFVKAAEIFFETYRRSPKGPKAPDTLLKLGMSLGNLGKKAEACAAFSKLTQEFPNPSPAIQDKLSRERISNACSSG